MNTPKNYTINQRIKHCRELCHLTQRQVAEFLGMKSSTYSQTERKGNITCDFLLKVASVLGVDPMFLLLDEADAYIPHLNSFLCPYTQITDKERRLIKLYRTLNLETRKEFYAFLSEKFKRQPEPEKKRSLK